MKNKMLFLIFIFSIMTINVYATEGELPNDSIITCNGKTYGKHENHWHIAIKNELGVYEASGEEIATNPCEEKKEPAEPITPPEETQTTTQNQLQETKEEPKKSNDTSVKSITIDNDDIDLEKLKYSTKKSNVSIKIVAKDPNATVEYSKSKKLVIGKNEVSFNVIAEDGTKKAYKILIMRLAQSSNTDIIVKVNDSIIKFKDYESDLIYLKANTKNLDIDYTLADKKSNVEIIGNNNLSYGESQIKINVIAEDDTEATYIINVYRYRKSEELVTYITAIAIIVIFFGGIGYYFLKSFCVPKNK